MRIGTVKERILTVPFADITSLKGQQVYAGFPEIRCGVFGSLMPEVLRRQETLTSWDG